MPLVYNLEAKLGRPIEIFFAFDGKEWLDDPSIKKGHPLVNQEITQGNIGCTQSHLYLIRTSLMADLGGICIFEDDCTFTASPEEIQTFCEAAEKATDGKWDLLLFGATEYVNAKPDPKEDSLCRPSRFWGTHAVIVRPKAGLAIIDTFAEFQEKGIFPPADWLYSRAISKHGLICVGPKKPLALCCQKEGLLSLVTGRIR
jgi:GR25 family glycosyltransferase involved in LPS biosynthesis